MLLLKHVARLGDYMKNGLLPECEVNNYDNFIIMKNMLRNHEIKEIRYNRKNSS